MRNVNTPLQKPTTNKQRKTRFIEACYQQYRTKENLGSRKRQVRRALADKKD